MPPPPPPPPPAPETTIPPPPDEPPPGLKGQFGATRDAAKGMFQAHVDLAKAEFEVIGDEVKRAAALGGVAIASLILLAILLPIGLALFVGEWLFGSIGWGVLHATLLYVAIAVAAGLAALRVPGVGRSLLGGIVIGVLVTALLATNALNLAYTELGRQAGIGIDPVWMPTVVGLAIGAVVLGLLGLVLGLRAGGGGAVAGLILGLLLGAALGAFTSITFSWEAAVALGIATALGSWIGLMGAAVASAGIDGEALKARFYPETTIETTKETIEWIRARAPLGPKP